MSGWESQFISGGRKNKNVPLTLTEEIAEILQVLSVQVKKIEQYSNELENNNSDSLRKQLINARMQAKKNCKIVVEKIKEREMKANFKDKEEKLLFQKLKKQCAATIKHFEQISKRSLEKEKEIANRINQKIIEHENQMSEDKTYGRRKQHKQEETMQQKLVLTEWDAQTINTESQIQKERLEGIRQLEKDMDELVTCYRDLNEILKSQQEGIDAMERNVDEANASVEHAILDLQIANRYQAKQRGQICILILFVIFIIFAGGLTSYFIIFKPF